jgi:suppressor of ftsI
MLRFAAGREAGLMSRNLLRRPVAVAISAGTALAALGAVVLVGCANNNTIISTVGEVDFDRPLSIPTLAPSTVNAAGERVFELTAGEGSTSIRPGGSTSTWGFSQSYLGPTLRATRGERVRVTVKNELDEPTTVHWHGMHLPAKMDGGPHQSIEAGSTWEPNWTIDQPATTLWYHPHLHGETEEHVSRGLAGMFIIDDAAEASLGLPGNYGVDDIPLIVHDVRLDDENQFDNSVRGSAGLMGDSVVVNGTAAPFLDVVTDVVRLRLLNASPARVFTFAMSDERPLALVGTDGGLLEEPYETDAVQLSPGERAQVLVRMSPGETVVLRSTPPDLGIADGNATGNGGNDSFDLLELRAAAALTPAGTVPERLRALEPQPVPTETRTFELSGTNINDDQMNMGRIDEVVTVGTTEEWLVRNEQNQPHSFHVHDVQFRVRSVDGAAPPPELAGWKDTIYLRPETDYRLVMTFTDYTDDHTPYMFHCHLLWHEDRGMMGQFLVVSPGSDATRGAATIQGETHDH